MNVRRVGYDWLLALLLAVLSWYLVTGRERVDTWVRVRIETAGLAEGLVLRGAPRDYLDVLVRGPKGLVRKLDPSELVYTLDARKLAPGANTVVIAPESIPVSKLFEVVEVRPSRLELEVERRLARAVPVRLAFRDGAQRDYKLSGSVEPSQVTVSGPESVVKGIDFVPVQPITLPEDGTGRLETPVNLVLPEQVEAQPRSVRAQVNYQLLTREAAVEVPVRVAGASGHVAHVSPESVMLRLRAPLPLLREGAWRGLVDAFVEMPPGLAPGRHETTYRVTLPQGCELIQARPEKVTVLVK
ncbi:CdaR family protein [Fundidesulfovibrio magnetotacticus]|nr:CdaR family protein [Fundidesulfovibrio magnetotacticus]